MASFSRSSAAVSPKLNIIRHKRLPQSFIPTQKDFTVALDQNIIYLYKQYTTHYKIDAYFQSRSCFHKILPLRVLIQDQSGISSELSLTIETKLLFRGKKNKSNV